VSVVGGVAKVCPKVVVYLYPFLVLKVEEIVSPVGSPRSNILEKACFLKKLSSKQGGQHIKSKVSLYKGLTAGVKFDVRSSIGYVSSPRHLRLISGSWAVMDWLP
jgi:hypothetical protein